MNLTPMTIYRRVNPDKLYADLFEGRWVFIGEIVNMPGHGVFIRTSDFKVVTGLHMDSFEAIPEDEM